MFLSRNIVPYAKPFFLSVPLTTIILRYLSIHQSAYRDRCQLKTPTLPRTGFYYGRDTLIDGFFVFGSTHIPKMPLVENFAPIM